MGVVSAVIELLDLNFPKANKAMLKRLYWQQIIKISDQFESIDGSGMTQADVLAHGCHTATAN